MNYKKFLSIFLSIVVFLFVFSSCKQKDDYEWKGYDSQDLISLFKENRELFDQTLRTITDNERFWNEGRQEGSAHAWLMSPNDKDKMNLFSESEQNVIKNFFFMTFPYQISLTDQRYVEFTFINKEKTDGFIIAYYYGNKSTISYNDQTAYDMWITGINERYSIFDLNEGWFLYFKK